MTLYIIRHGQTELNRLGITQGSSPQTNYDLNEKGQAQAEAFFNAFQHIDFELIVTSELKRTHQTVSRFIERNIPWHRTPDLNEISWGVNEGLAYSPERDRRYYAAVEAWTAGDLDHAITGGESARQLLERVDRFVEWVKQRPEQRILVATHGRTMRCLIAHLQGLSPAEMQRVEHHNAGLYVARWTGEGWMFERENDTDHLQHT